MKLPNHEAPTIPVWLNDTPVVTGSLSTRWGWVPALSVTSAVGVFLVGLAYEGGRLSAQWADPLFWFGLLVIYLPIAMRLFSSRPTRWERIALLVVLVITLYIVKYMQYPLYFAYFDEFTHTRTTQDILASGHLFQPNPILAISPLYPGLEIVTSTVSNLTGLSIFASGLIVIGVARLVFGLSLYLFYEVLGKYASLSNAAQIAGIATVLYMSNPSFVFDDADFAYESLAISLAVFVLFVIALRSCKPGGRRRSLTPVTWLGLGAVVVTHHLTSYTLVAFLLLWTLIFLLLWVVGSLRQGRSGKSQAGPDPGGAGLLGLVLSIAWLVLTGGIAAGYLDQYPITAIGQLLQIVTGQSGPRKLFHSVSGVALPLWEPVLSYASVALILLALPFGLFYIGRHYRTNAIFLALAGGAIAYPVSLAFRLTPAGAEGSDRASEFVFLGVAFVLAIGATRFLLRRAPRWWSSVMLMGVVGVIFVGQTVIGNGQLWSRLPGPYLVVADQRSIEPEGIDAAKWAATYLGPGHRIATDRINMLLMSTYGNQWVVTISNNGVSVSPIFTSLKFGPQVTDVLEADNIQYIVVDRRLSTALPQIRAYYDVGIPGTLTSPISPVALAKFDGVQGVSRVFDSGDIIIYDVESITNAPPPALPSGPPPVPRHALPKKGHVS
jgi:hypothetical protein